MRLRRVEKGNHPDNLLMMRRATEELAPQSLVEPDRRDRGTWKQQTGHLSPPPSTSADSFLNVFRFSISAGHARVKSFLNAFSWAVRVHSIADLSMTEADLYTFLA